MKKTKLCPYRASSGNKCHHKYCVANCPYNNPEKCLYYNELVKNAKVDSRAVSDDIRAIQELSNE